MRAKLNYQNYLKMAEKMAIAKKQREKNQWYMGLSGLFISVAIVWGLYSLTIGQDYNTNSSGRERNSTYSISYRPATLQDIVVGVKLNHYLSSDIVIDNPSTITQTDQTGAYLQHSDGSGGWRTYEELTTTTTFENGSFARWEVRQ